MLAAQLARFGIKLRLIDKKPQPSSTSKALSVFARTLEIFDNLGIAQEAIKRGHKLYGANIYDDGRRIAHINLDKLDSFFPFVLSLPQSETEDILGKLVESLGITIERSVTFVDLEQDTEGVVEPATGDSFWGEFSHLDRICFQDFLDLFAQESPDALNLIQMDNATPLFLILLHETWKWLRDDWLLRDYRDVALRCLDWIDRYGDLDGDRTHWDASVPQGDVEIKQQAWQPWQV